MVTPRMPKFTFGDVVSPIDQSLVKMRVLGITRYTDGSVGYICSHWAYYEQKQQRHNMSEEELVRFGAELTEAQND